MKKLIALLVLCAPLVASAETMNISGNVGGSCTFSGNTTGLLTVVGTSVSSDAPAAVQIDNNDAGGFTLTIDPVTALSTGPVTALTSNASLVPSIAGDNSAGSFSGDDTTGYTQLLANAGTDTLTINASGVLSQTATAGFYNMSINVTCLAL